MLLEEFINTTTFTLPRVELRTLLEDGHSLKIYTRTKNVQFIDEATLLVEFEDYLAYEVTKSYESGNTLRIDIKEVE